MKGKLIIISRHWEPSRSSEVSEWFQALHLEDVIRSLEPFPFQDPIHLVTQVGNWGTGNDDVGLLQSTKAPKPGGRSVAGISSTSGTAAGVSRS